MQVKILGSAAGGGFPQWNCACSNCARLRAGTFRGGARTQAQLAVREPGKPWCLINASPDLRSQILADPDLAPQSAPRQSPIAAVILTGADVDQVIGLLHLREFHPFEIYSTPAVETLLRGENSLFNALQQTQPQADWKSIEPGKPASIQSSDGVDLGLSVTASTIATKLPGYSERRSTADTSSTDTVIALEIETAGGAKLFCAPALPVLEQIWLADWNECDAILVDGTFWSENKTNSVARAAAENLRAAWGIFRFPGPVGRSSAWRKSRAHEKSTITSTIPTPSLMKRAPNIAPYVKRGGKSRTMEWSSISKRIRLRTK